MLTWSGLPDWHDYLRLLIGLLAIVNPLLTVPLFLGFARGRSEPEKRGMAVAAAATVLVTLLIFTFFGKAILDMFAISLESFQIAGGILLMLTALEMMRSQPGGAVQAQNNQPGSATSVGIVPLGIPMMAGPGAIIATVIEANAHASFSHKFVVGFVVLVVSAAILVVFQIAGRAGSMMRPTAMTVFNRVTGLIIASIAVEFIAKGLAQHFPSLLQRG